jgi:5,10-methylene-tetrahydrofolate dehydrogenase/methenyl tetrahydrofolate cyclohydrolase
MNINIFSLKNKKIIVVGGSGLIGLEVSNLLNNLGAKVFNFDINKNKNLSKEINFEKFDVTKESSIKKKWTIFSKKMERQIVT